MTDLSSAAQAVLDAVREISPAPADEIAAVALRAAADQVVPEEELPAHARGTSYWHRTIQRAETRNQLLAIAAELRGITTTTETP